MKKSRLWGALSTCVIASAISSYAFGVPVSIVDQEFNASTLNTADIPDGGRFISSNGADEGQSFSVLDSADPPQPVDTSMVEQGFEGFIAYIPLPAAVWLFGSGLLVLIGIARRKKA